MTDAMNMHRFYQLMAANAPEEVFLDINFKSYHYAVISNFEQV